MNLTYAVVNGEYPTCVRGNQMLCLSSSEGVAQTNPYPDGFEYVSDVARQTLPFASVKNVAKILCENIMSTNA